jgi:hypothetical protein
MTLATLRAVVRKTIPAASIPAIGQCPASHKQTLRPFQTRRDVNCSQAQVAVCSNCTAMVNVTALHATTDAVAMQAKTLGQDDTSRKKSRRQFATLAEPC